MILLHSFAFVRTSNLVMISYLLSLFITSSYW